MKKTILTVLVAGILSAPTSASAGIITTYFDKSAFLSATGATSATGLLPNLSPTTVSSLTVGSVTISTLSGALWFGALGVTETDWTTRLPGHDLAVNNLEKIQVDMASYVSSFGFDFVEPENDPWVNAPFVDSTFAVSLFDGALLIDSFSFNAPNDVAAFVGLSSDMLFNRVTIVETTGGIENEFFGQFYTAKIPEPGTLVLFGLGLACLGFTLRRKAA
jgi:hypothetical protein